MYSTNDIPSLAGKNFVVTGGHSGLGYETCLYLALHKAAIVIIACRSEDKANEAIAKISEMAPSTNLVFVELKLNDLKQVKTAAQKIVDFGVTIDVLINNAGIANTPFALSTDGIEEQFAYNHVGPFLFTTTLLPALLKSAEPRIVNISSHYHTQVSTPSGILFDSINDPNAMTDAERYAQSRLATILFSKALHKRVGSRVYINTVDPGNDVRSSGTTPQKESKIHHRISGLFGGNAAAKADAVVVSSVLDAVKTPLYAATSKDIVEKGYKDAYFAPVADKERGDKELSELAKDKELAERLWEFTESLIKEKIMEAPRIPLP
ncbi:hypothetical protein HDU79_011105 [Rhizoclosmatium sp. JEL0117]|nr:hypothetical protein HDU79_011105 [Rhizoclosmatium sp. JEL0117]